MNEHAPGGHPETRVSSAEALRISWLAPVPAEPYPVRMDWTAFPLDLALGAVAGYVTAHLALRHRSRDVRPSNVTLPPEERPVSQGCALPPPGWYCTREVGHGGPCAAYPIDDPRR